MRLKFLFFPLMLLICVFVFIKFVLPEFGRLNEANKAKKDAQQLLKNIEEKKKAVNLLSQKISETAEYKDVVYNYLPNRKVEEQIIASVNFLAADAQVYLVDISIDNVASGKAGLRSAAPAVNVSSETGEAADVAQNKEMLSSKTTIKVLGDYENIQLFLGQLQRMALINNLKSINISKQTENAPASSSEGETNQSTKLVAEIAMDFGYLEQVKVNADNLAKFEATLDDNVVKVLSNYTSRKMVSALPSSSDIAEGKVNPFFP